MLRCIFEATATCLLACSKELACPSHPHTFWTLTKGLLRVLTNQLPLSRLSDGVVAQVLLSDHHYGTHLSINVHLPNQRRRRRRHQILPPLPPPHHSPTIKSTPPSLSPAHSIRRPSSPSSSSINTRLPLAQFLGAALVDTTYLPLTQPSVPAPELFIPGGGSSSILRTPPRASLRRTYPTECAVRFGGGGDGIGRPCGMRCWVASVVLMFGVNAIGDH